MDSRSQYSRDSFGFSNFQEAYSKPNNLVPKQGVIFSDEDMRYRTPDQFNTHIKKKRILFSDRNEKSSSQLPEDFSNTILDNIKNVRWIRPIKAHVTYTVPATKVYNALVFFENLSTGYQRTSDGTKYHCWINLIDGTTGTSVSFVENFDKDAVVEFKNPVNVPSGNFPIKVYAQNDTTGLWDLFTDLTRFAIEVEFNYLDYSFRNDIQVKL